MSKFSTKLPVDFDALLAALPKQSSIHAVTLNPDTKQVIVVWSNDIFESGLTVPTDFEFEDVKKKKLPAGVRDARKKVSAPAQPEVIHEAPPDVPALKVEAPRYMTEAEVAEAVKSGNKVEFQGIEIGWKPFTDADVFTKGFFYRYAA